MESKDLNKDYFDKRPGNVDFDYFDLQAHSAEIENLLDVLLRLEPQVLESLLSELKLKEKFVNVHKRAPKSNDRKRPGWELAYGKRKRSMNLKY